MDELTALLLLQLSSIREQLVVGAARTQMDCPVDKRYAEEWALALNLVEIYLGNIQAAVADGSDDKEVRAMLDITLGSTVPAIVAIQEGYIEDLVNCKECDKEDCTLKRRARMLVEFREVTRQ